MAMEPITLFSRIADPALVLKRLRELNPNVTIHGPERRWQKLIVNVGSWWKKKTLTLTHDPEYYSEPNWARQLQGMRGYFGQFPDTDRKTKVMMLTTTLKFSLGVLFKPDFDPSGDPRLDLLYAITEALDGVLFTPSGLRDARGRILYGAGGEEIEDPDAKWPHVIAAVDIAEYQSMEGPAEPADPPNAQRVVRRALALSAVTSRAMLEQETKNSEGYRRLLQWIEEIGIQEELEPDEWEVLQRPLGKLDQQMHVNSVCRLEGLCVLAWALYQFEIPPHDQRVHPEFALGMHGSSRRLFGRRKSCQIRIWRPRNEIEALRKRLLALHWRPQNFHLHPGTIDFAEFSERAGLDRWISPNYP